MKWVPRSIQEVLEAEVLLCEWRRGPQDPLHMFCGLKGILSWYTPQPVQRILRGAMDNSARRRTWEAPTKTIKEAHRMFGTKRRLLFTAAEVEQSMSQTSAKILFQSHIVLTLSALGLLQESDYVGGGAANPRSILKGLGVRDFTSVAGAVMKEVENPVAVLWRHRS